MKKNLLFLVLLVIYNFLFWNQQAGINLIIFSLLILMVNLGRTVLKPGSALVLIAGAWLCSAYGVLRINSEISVVVLTLSTITALGYLAGLPSVAESFSNGVLSFFRIKAPVFPEKVAQRRNPRGVRYAYLSILPLLVFFLYYIIFSAANPVFKEYSEAAFGNVLHIFTHWHWGRFWFLLLGVLLVRWAFMKVRKSRLQLSDSDKLQRKSQKLNFRHLSQGLRHEHITAIILFSLLNLLFAVVNFIDVKFVWFQFHHSAVSLKDLLHQGFYWLILSLLLSIGLILYFFRGNLNFYPGNRKLKILGQLWIVQNLVLAASVALRTYYYIKYHGLASGRILVMVFLVMVFFGLLTLMLKVAYQRNFAYMLRINSAFILGVLAICALVNWSNIMVKVNLNHTYENQVDVNHYLEVDPQALPLVWRNLDKVGQQIEEHNKNATRWISYSSLESFEEHLQRLSEAYVQNRKQLEWYSWTYADQKAVAQLDDILQKRSAAEPNDTETSSASLQRE